MSRSLVAWVRVHGGELVLNIRRPDGGVRMAFPLEEAWEIVDVFLSVRRTPGSDMTVHDMPDTHGPRMALTHRECTMIAQVAAAVLYREGARGCARGAA